MAQGPAVVLDETLIGQGPLAELTIETIWMPTVVQRLDYTPNDKLSTLSATGRKEHLKVVFAVLPAAKFIVNFRLVERLEALGADKAALVEHVAVSVHYLLLLLEALVAMRTEQRVG